MGKDLLGNELGEGISQIKNGSYEARFIDDKGDRISIYNKDLTHLKTMLSNIKCNQLNRCIEHTYYTLSDWFDIWINEYKYGVIKSTTKSSYIQIFNKHIKSMMGDKLITEIKMLDIKRMINNLEKNGVGFSVRNRIKIMLSDMFDKAVIDDYMFRNPAKNIRVAKKEEIERRFLNIAELQDFLYTSRGFFYENLFLVALNTGMRQGEICAITPEDIDFDKKVIKVNKTLLYQKLENDTKKTFHIKDTKTMASDRVIPMTSQCIEALRKQIILHDIVMSKRTAKPLDGFKNLIFTTWLGTPLNSTDVSAAIKKIIREINYQKNEAEYMQNFSCHAFRHTFASRAFEAGVDARTLQYILGHSSLKLTLELYTHISDEIKQSAMNLLENKYDSINYNLISGIEKTYNNLIISEYNNY